MHTHVLAAEKKEPKKIKKYSRAADREEVVRQREKESREKGIVFHGWKKSKGEIGEEILNEVGKVARRECTSRSKRGQMKKIEKFFRAFAEYRDIRRACKEVGWNNIRSAYYAIQGHFPLFRDIAIGMGYTPLDCVAKLMELTEARMMYWDKNTKEFVDIADNKTQFWATKFMADIFRSKDSAGTIWGGKVEGVVNGQPLNISVQFAKVEKNMPQVVRDGEDG